MGLIACTQEHIAPDECCNCGFWLHNIQQGGFPGPAGRYCSEECASDAQDRIELGKRRHHLNTRDLMCAWEEVCAPAGHPTVDEIAEWNAYQQQVTR